MKKIISILLIICLSLSSMACANLNDDDNIKKEQINIPSPPPFTKTDVTLFNNGYSEYKIVLSSNPQDREIVAADELNYFFKEATGYEFEIIDDSEKYHTKANRYISIGKNRLLATSGIIVPNEELGQCGFLLKTVNNSLFLTGRTDDKSDGTIYAVYELLYCLFNYRQYAPTEYTIDRDVKLVKLINVDSKNIPDIPIRTIGSRTMINDPTYERRMRLQPYSNEDWVTSGHAQTDLIPPKIYSKDHPDWFDETKETLCYSNQEMKAFMIEKLKTVILASKGFVVHLGQADTHAQCKCAKCEVGLKEKYMNSAGQQIAFVNDIAEALEPWAKENVPERKLRFSTFAYHYSEAAPCVYNKETNKYEPFSKYVIPRENVGIYWAPINMDYAKAINDPTSINVTSMTALKAWNDLLGEKKIYLWSYCTNFLNYFVNAVNMGATAENYKVFAEYGIQYIFDQGPVDCVTSTYEELRLFVQSQLLWDTKLDVNYLVKEFIDNYYKDASKFIYKQYSDMQSWYAHLLKTNTNFTGQIYNSIGSVEYWPKGVLDNFNDTFADAFAEIEKYKETDFAKYSMLHDRIMKINMPVQFLILSHYRAYYKPNQLKIMIDDFEKYANRFMLFNYGEVRPLAPIIDGWRKSL